MTITSANDVSVVLSGGSINIDPNASLGGEPSSSPITDNTLNNLFADITSDQSASGYEDFRCVYFFNDGPTNIYNVKLWIGDDLDTGGGSVDIGIQQQNETQRVTITGTVTGGSFTLSYLGMNFGVAFNADLGVWASNFQNSLNSLNVFNTATVLASNAGSSVIFDITFRNLDGSRSHESFVLAFNNLTPTPTLLISTTVQGSPINTIAAELDQETTPPGGVVFSDPTADAPLLLPLLAPNDGFPLWVRRTIPAQTLAQANDGLVLNFSADSLSP